MLPEIIKNHKASYLSHSLNDKKYPIKMLPRQRLFSLWFKCGYDPFLHVVPCFLLQVGRNAEQMLTVAIGIGIPIFQLFHRTPEVY